MAKKGAKPGGSKANGAARRDLFVKAFIANGGNATQAAITAGYSKKTAYSAGCRLLKRVDVAEAVNAVRADASERAGLTVERTLREVARLAYFDPRKLYDERGQVKAIKDLDDDTAACIAGIEIDEIAKDGNFVGFTKKVRHWDKNVALDKAMKHLGLYERDNKQRPLLPESVQINVIAVRAGATQR